MNYSALFIVLPRRTTLLTREILYELYIVKKLAIRKVAKELGYSPSGIRYALEAHEIPIRSKSEAQTGELNFMSGVVGEEHPRYGKKHSEEFKKRLSMLRSGENNPRYGHRLTEVYKYKRSKHPNLDWKLKSCANCKDEYLDKTKRKVGKTCSKKCACELAVRIRKEKGSYVRTEKYRDPNLTPHERKEKHIKANLEKYGVEHWTQTTKARKEQSKRSKSMRYRPEHQKYMCEQAMKSQKIYSRSIKGKREDLGCFFRSTWEANYARYLNHLGIKWKYEAITYQLGDNKTYTPDFLLDDGSLVEIKGWLTKKGAEKINLFKLIYPHVILNIVDRTPYNAIKAQYQYIIPNWE